jgi:hypothetical protein
MSVYPFELDYSDPISAGLAHCCARAASGHAARRQSAMNSRCLN